MKRSWKRLGALLLTLAMVCAAAPGSVYAQQADSYEENTVDINDSELFDENLYDSVETEEAAPETDAGGLEAPQDDPESAAPDEETLSVDSEADALDPEAGDYTAVYDPETGEPVGETADVIPEGADDAELYSLIYNVEDFGVSGADQYLDRRGIQKALNEARTAGSPIVINVPAGIYYLDGSLTIYSNTKLKLDPKAVFVRDSGRAQKFSMLHTPKVGRGYNSASNITVEGGIWDGNSSRGTGLTSLMVFRHCQNLTFRNFTLTHGTDHFLNISSSSNVRVQGVTFSDSVAQSNGTVAGRNRANFECIHIDVEGVYGNGGKDGTVPQNVTITGCTFRNVYAGAGSHSYNTYQGKKCYARNIRITKNRFERVFGRCVNATQFTDLRVSGNTAVRVGCFAQLEDATGTISGNTAKILRVKGVDPYGIKVQSGPRTGGLTIGKNTLSGNVNRLLSLSQCRALKVTGNRLSGTMEDCMVGVSVCPGIRVSENTLSGTAGRLLCLWSSSRPVVYRNAFRGGTSDAIYLSESASGTIKGNRLTRVGKQGIRLTSDSGYNVISRNSILAPAAGGTQKGIALSAGSTKTLVTQNTIKNAAIGVYVTGHSGSSVTCNRIIGSGTAGIYLTGSAKNIRLSYNNMGVKGLKAASKATKKVLTLTRPKAMSPLPGTLSVSWKKIVSASGYQIQYARVKSFKGARVVMVPSRGTVKQALKGLRRRTRFFVRIRAYRQINGIKYYTGWSAMTSARTK